MKWYNALAIVALVALIGCPQPSGGVQPVKVTGITLSVNTLTLPVGTQYQLHATLEPWNATDQIILWGTDAPETATVSGGLVTAVSAVAPGIATITVYSAENGSISATCKVTVQ